MSMKVVTVHVDDLPASSTRILSAIAVASRLRAHLIGVFAVTSRAGSDAAVGGRRHRLIERAAEAQQFFLDSAAAAGVDAGWQNLICDETADTITAVTVAARHTDLIVLGQRDPDIIAESVPELLVELAVARAGRPALVIPYAGRYASIGQRAVVAWSGNRESARALADALPLLALAHQVKVLTINPEVLNRQLISGPLADVISYLNRHGILATAERLPMPNRSIGPAQVLLSYLADNAADLLVIGGIREPAEHDRKFRSVTGNILREMTVPILVSY